MIDYNDSLLIVGLARNCEKRLVHSIEKISSATKNFKNINLVGISCHIGSQIFSLNVYEYCFFTYKMFWILLISLNIHTVELITT